MHDFKKGDTIRCQSLDEAKVYMEGLNNDGYEASSQFDIRTKDFILTITKDKEAADE